MCNAGITVLVSAVKTNSLVVINGIVSYISLAKQNFSHVYASKILLCSRLFPLLQSLGMRLMLPWLLTVYSL